MLGSAGTFVLASAIVFLPIACSQSEHAAWETAGSLDQRSLRVIAAESTIASSRLPTILLSSDERASNDSFRMPVGIATSNHDYFILDTDREPHVTQVDIGSAETVRRFIPHLLANRDTIKPLGISLKSGGDEASVLLLDAQSRRLVQASTALSAAAQRPTFLDLRKILAPSDNPASIASASWGVALSGTMASGVAFVYSSNLAHWEAWRDTTRLRFGLPPESFMRSLAGTSIIGMHPSQPWLVLASLFQREIAIIDTRSGTLKRFSIDSIVGPPARLRVAKDKSVRIAWDTTKRRYFEALAVSDSLIALLDCDCRARPDTAADWRQIWLFGWNGHPLARMRSTRPVRSIAITRDGRSLLAAVADEGWYRLVKWPLKREEFLHQDGVRLGKPITLQDDRLFDFNHQGKKEVR